ncbi:MAG TPA: glycine cleavage T C-terminal barrel domain-containing protein [Candidatus Acidoferrales bacterium]|nr:glycine cleavage T C-terminal barrel domain-containing protein [Candidatus Acidoferrales bacterium]
MPIESPLREQHEKAGAELRVYFDCLLPHRFSDPAAEFRQALESVVLVDTNYHAFFYLEGPDRVRYLNAMLTNNIKDLVAGQGNVSLLLNPQGHILAEVETYALAERLLAVTHAGVRERTYATLDKFIIMDDVTLEDATDRTGSVALEGPQALALLRDLCGIDLEAMSDGAHRELSLHSIPCRVVRRSLIGSVGVQWIAERSQLAGLWQALNEAVHARGGAALGYAALNALRLEAGIPWFGYDFDDKVIPHEAGLESTHINYVKGCYTGQEIVERVRSRGHVNRRRVSLEFSGSRVPERGAKLFAGEQEVGYTTSAVAMPLAPHRVVGMGYVRREHNAPGSRLRWADGEAEVIERPRTSVHAAAERPAS